jgi:hypothetical protein
MCVYTVLNYLLFIELLSSPLYLIYGTAITTPIRLVRRTRAENAKKMIASGLLVPVKQHSTSEQVFTQSGVCSPQSSQKFTYRRTHGIKRAMPASKLMAQVRRKPNASVLRISPMPITTMERMELMRLRTPRMNPRACGIGPLKSSEIHMIIEERRTMALRRKMTDSIHAIIVTNVGIFIFFPPVE